MYIPIRDYLFSGRIGSEVHESLVGQSIRFLSSEVYALKFS